MVRRMQPDERAFAAGEHPHVPAGSSSGGQFAPKKQSKATKSTPAKHPPANHAPAKHGTGHAPAKNDGGNFAYDGKTGAGYGMPGGSPKVKSLQADLIRLGLASKTDKAFNDGKYGPKTSAAVKKAQKALGMKPDGIATPALIAKLAAAKNLPHRSLDEDDVFLRAGAELHISITDRPVVKQVTEGRSHGSQMKEGATMAVERRYTLVPVELRVVGDKPRIGGYAAMFERVSQNLGGFVEVVERSFFNKSRGDGWPDVMARYNHDDNMLLGTSGAGTLQLSLDETGLDYLVDPPQSRADVVELVQRGDVRKSSFAFRLPKEGDEWTMSDQGYPLRRLVTGALVDVAPVNAPAYLDTSAGLRSLAERMDADETEVRSAAEANELHRFFKVVSGAPMPKPKPRTFGAAAMVALLQKKEDPWI
jgi:HK97 family phage prohead protease